MVYTTYLWGFGGWFIIVLLCFININLLIIASSHGMICASPLVCWIRTEFSTMKRRNDISYLKGPRRNQENEVDVYPLAVQPDHW